MKAIKIDVEKKTVYEVELPDKGSQLKAIYEHLGCDCFCQAARLSDKDTVLVDDNGLYHKYEDIKGIFFIEGQPQPLVGNGLVVGNDDQGESIDVTLSVEKVWSKVIWPPKEVIEPWLLR